MIKWYIKIFWRFPLLFRLNDRISYIWLPTKTLYYKSLRGLIFIIFSNGSCPRVEVFRFADIRKIPEGFRKLVRKLTCSLQFPRSSGRSRKVSGSLSGSLFHFRVYPCNSGRFRKVPGSLSGSLFEEIDLPHSGSFRKVSGSLTGRGFEHEAIGLHLASQTIPNVLIF